MKGKEVQRRTRTDVSRTPDVHGDTYDEHDAYIPDVSAYNDSYAVQYEVPDWAVPVPAYTQGATGIKATVEYTWSLIMRWPRYLAVAFLYTTASPWRFIIITITIALVLFALVSKGL